MTELQKDRQGKSSIAPTFSKGGYNEGARVLTRLYVVFSDAQRQLTPKSASEFCRNSN